MVIACGQVDGKEENKATGKEIPNFPSSSNFLDSLEMRLMPCLLHIKRLDTGLELPKLELEIVTVSGVIGLLNWHVRIY